jgi:two-component system cell cycle response regulator DivK
MSSMRLLPDATAPAHSRAAGRQLADFSRTVLVVDDHEDSRLLIRYLLEQKGWRVIEAADGLEAVETARGAHPDLILMDVGLPLLDGLSATRRIREDVEMRSVPIVAVSGYAMAEDRARALAAGCDGYIPKPIDFDELYHLVCLQIMH